MDTEKCKILLYAIETGSLSAAANALGYTVSGVSRAIASLEAETGCPLLLRHRKGVSPTKACSDLLPTIRQLLYWEKRYQQIAWEIQGVETGNITVATAYNSCYPWLADLIASFSQTHPNIRVDITEGTSSQLAAQLEEGNIDFCIISRRKLDCQWISLRFDQLLAWVPSSHPAAASGRLPLTCLKNESYIQIHPGVETDNARMLAEENITPNIRFSTSDVYAAYSMVEAGLGIALINQAWLKDWRGACRTDAVCAIPLDPPHTVEIGIAAPPVSHISPAAQRFLAFAESKRDTLLL